MMKNIAYCLLGCLAFCCAATGRAQAITGWEQMIGGNGTPDDVFAKRVEAVAARTFEENLTRVKTYNDYLGPMWQTTTPEDPSDPEALSPRDDDDVYLTIFGKPETLRLVWDLKAMPKEQATAFINAELKSARADYRRLFDESLKRKIESLAKFKATHPTGTLAFSSRARVESEPAMPGTMEGLRMEILALVFSVGVLRLEGAAGEVLATLRLAQAQRAQIFSEPSFDPMHRGSLRDMLLWNRRIFSTSLLNLKIASKKQAKGFKVVKQTLPHYRVLRTSMGHWYVPQQLSPEEKTLGVIKFRTINQLDEATFRRMVEASLN